MDSDDENNVGSWRGVPGSVILINVYESTAAVRAHEAVCDVIKHCLRLSSSCNVGVCLYGTGNVGSSAFDIKNITDIIPLTVPNLEEFKRLKNINITDFGHAVELKLSDALWQCSKMFANCKKLLSSRTVIILSKLDVPPVEVDQKPTLKRVVDLVDSDIEIRIINISQSEYKIHPFYEDFMIEANKGKNVVMPKHIWDEKEIQQLLHQLAHRLNAVSILNLEIGNTLSIGVGIYSLLKSNTYSKTNYVDRETNATVTSVTKTMKTTPADEDSDANNEPKQIPLLKSEVLHYQEFGGERVEFTDNEMNIIKNPFGPPMIKLLGFKPATLLRKEKWFLKPCYFLHPSEKLIKGSITAFKALHQACAEMEMVGICVLSTRVNSKPLVVALSPCSFPLGLDVEIGFDVIPIPFAENIREVPVDQDEITDISESQKSITKKILENLKFDYKPDMFENPKLQCEYRAIEAIALEEENVEPFVDTTKADPKVYKNINDGLFQELFGPFAANEPKRATTLKAPGPSNKRKKEEDINKTLENRIANKTVALYTVSELKQILKSRVIPELPGLTGLKKNQLVDYVYQYCR